MLIEQAKGMLTQRGSIDMDTAFAPGRNLRLGEVAARVVDADLAGEVLAAGGG